PRQNVTERGTERMNTPDNDPAELDAELRAIVRAAAELPTLSPSRELWSGIASRIEAPVVALPTRIANGDPTTLAPAAQLPWPRLAIAASLLIVATAGVTWSIVKHGSSAELAARSDSATVEAPLAGAPGATVALEGLEATDEP